MSPGRWKAPAFAALLAILSVSKATELESTRGMSPHKRWRRDKIVQTILQDSESFSCGNTEKTTIVLMSYSPDRGDNVARVFQTYGAMEAVFDRIVFIWNNQNAQPPEIPSDTKVPIILWKAPRNTLNNRFNVSRFVRTPSVVSVDDDLLVNEPMICWMIKTHQEYPSRIVGLDKRSFGPDGTYSYIQMPGWLPVSLTKSWIISTNFLGVYMRDSNLTGFVDEVVCCEDIGMSFVVRNATGDNAQYAMALPLNRTYRRRELPEPGGLSVSGGRQKWLDLRKHCVRWMMRHFDFKLKDK